ncbi:hypothetical protein SLEP1_g48033 [Rubroshorea leprosula]|uniref:Uncharacterized protein n=1 Tax=Rubroshorea leprosula TaxID=152421 RepID=A0AAV5LTE6_9ROSI|nr:hypothetical protein SLEP1_g48033 [Rubroshorea leprosula]
MESSSSSLPLNGRVAIVTGASRGIGQDCGCYPFRKIG